METKVKRNSVQCCHGNLVIPTVFAVISLLLRDSDTINQSNVQNCSAYTITIIVIIIIIIIVTIIIVVKSMII